MILPQFISTPSLQVVYSDILEAPIVKPWKFSGGVNETRKAWNLAEWNRCAKVVHLKDSNTLLVPSFMRQEFEAMLAKAGL